MKIVRGATYLMVCSTTLPIKLESISIYLTVDGDRESCARQTGCEDDACCKAFIVVNR